VCMAPRSVVARIKNLWMHRCKEDPSCIPMVWEYITKDPNVLLRLETPGETLSSDTDTARSANDGSLWADLRRFPVLPRVVPRDKNIACVLPAWPSRLSAFRSAQHRAKLAPLLRTPRRCRIALLCMSQNLICPGKRPDRPYQGWQSDGDGYSGVGEAGVDE
jgi:hypothetical protein